RTVFFIVSYGTRPGGPVVRLKSKMLSYHKGRPSVFTHGVHWKSIQLDIKATVYRL
ncbi:hypothetical protein CEXT_503481, partial [Caerostris extrusa]